MSLFADAGAWFDQAVKDTGEWIDQAIQDTGDVLTGISKAQDDDPVYNNKPNEFTGSQDPVDEKSDAKRRGG